jgi:hypothetical protein
LWKPALICKDGVVRWRSVDLRRVIKKRFGVDLDEVSIPPGIVLEPLEAWS